MAKTCADTCIGECQKFRQIIFEIYSDCLPSKADLPNRLRHRPREDYIVRLRLLSFPLILALHCRALQLTMTPLENELLHILGLGYLQSIEELSIMVFFYGAPSSVTVWPSSTSSITGLFVILFSASVIIFASVFSFRKAAYFSTRPNPRNLTGGKVFLTARQQPCS